MPCVYIYMLIICIYIIINNYYVYNYVDIITIIYIYTQYAGVGKPSPNGSAPKGSYARRLPVLL